MATCNLLSVLGNKFLTADGREVDAHTALGGKTVAVYFGASWCPPCRDLTPRLVTRYAEIRELTKDFELIWVSRDKREEDYHHHRKHMLWLSLPYEARENGNKLKLLLSIYFVPMIIIIGPDGGLISRYANHAIFSNLSNYPFYSQPVEPLQDGNFSPLEPVLVALIEDETEETKAHMIDLLHNVGEEIQARARAEGDLLPMVVRYAAEENFFPTYFRKGTGLPFRRRHVHPMTEDLLHSPGGERAGWACDGCNMLGNRCQGRFSCKICHLDYCEICYDVAEREPYGLKMPSAIVIAQKVDREMISHLYPWERLDVEGLRQFVDDFKAGRLDNPAAAAAPWPQATSIS